MSSKLYLIRKRHETIIGPHNLSEIARLYGKGQCGTDDEVSGSKGPWIYIKDSTDLTKHYPEIFDIFHTGKTKENLISAYEGYDAPSHNNKKRPALPPYFIWIFVLILICAGGVIFYLAHYRQVKLIAEVLRLHQKQEYPLAMEILKKNNRLVVEIGKRATASAKWLPVLRTYAFWEETKLPPRLAKLVRGKNVLETPPECDLARWKSIWRHSPKSWSAFLKKQQLITGHWSLLLSWDPYWLRERIAEGWQYPRSYEHGCFLSAYKAFIGMTMPDNEHATLIRERIMWQSRVLSSVQETYEVVFPKPPAHPLLIWNCMEQSTDLKSLEKCRRVLRKLPATPMVAYSQQKYIWNKYRIIKELHQNKNSFAPRLKLPTSPPHLDSYNAINYQKTVEYLAKIKNKKK